MFISSEAITDRRFYIYKFMPFFSQTYRQNNYEIYGHWFEESLPKLANIYIDYLGAEK